jgi:transposase-like protein
MTSLVLDDYIRRCTRGEKLEQTERRAAVAMMLTLEPDIANTEIARRLNCDPGTVRNDIRAMKKANAEDVRADTDIKVIVADMLEARNQALRNNAKTLKALERLGKEHSREYMAATREMLAIHMRVTKALSDLGWLPKNLGTVQVKRQVYRAIVQDRTGTVETRPMDLFDDIREGESVQEAILRKAAEQDLLVATTEVAEDGTLLLPGEVEGEYVSEGEDDQEPGVAEETSN